LRPPFYPTPLTQAPPFLHVLSCSPDARPLLLLTTTGLRSPKRSGSTTRKTSY
jgi:hypothetical protein